jgi:GNAT superfamily N-acetyltransferase
MTGGHVSLGGYNQVRMAVVKVVTETDVPMLVARFPEQGAAPVSRHVARFELQKQNLITYLAAWEGDEPAGYVFLRWSGSPDLTEQAKRLGCVELADLWVAEHMRGRGIGRQLLEAAESVAAARGHLRLGLEVTMRHPFNARARQLYERSGFRDAGFAPFVSGYTYWDASGVSHRDEDVYVYLVKELD